MGAPHPWVVCGAPLLKKSGVLMVRLANMLQGVEKNMRSQFSVLGTTCIDITRHTHTLYIPMYIHVYASDRLYIEIYIDLMI